MPSWLESLYYKLVPEWACPPVCTPVDVYWFNAAVLVFLLGLFEERIRDWYHRRFIVRTWACDEGHEFRAEAPEVCPVCVSLT